MRGARFTSVLCDGAHRANVRSRVPFEFSANLVLSQEPEYPEHITFDDDGVPYHTAVSVTPALPPTELDWAAMVFGIETDRFGAREQFLATLRTPDVNLDEHGRVLVAAFHDIFGGRGVTRDTAGYVAWLRDALSREADPARRACLERGLDERRTARRPRDERDDIRRVAFASEQGHVPVDYDAVLYWMSALIPGWEQLRFAQVDSDDEEHGVYTLRAYWAGRRFDAVAENHGDFVEPWSCAGLLNVMLRDVARCDHRLHVTSIDEGCTIVGGRIARLRELIADGELLHPDDAFERAND